MYAYIMQHYLAIKRNEMLMSSVMAFSCNSSTQETEAGGLLQVPGQPGLHSEFLGQSRQHRFCLKKQNKTKNGPQTPPNKIQI